MSSHSRMEEIQKCWQRAMTPGYPPAKAIGQILEASRMAEELSSNTFVQLDPTNIERPIAAAALGTLRSRQSVDDLTDTLGGLK